MLLIEEAATLMLIALRFIGSVIKSIVIELLIMGPGYLICRIFSASIEPDSFRVFLVGCVFWLTLSIISFHFLGY